ncbi:Ccc1 family [Piptocephalis cylindrospora]|uniref:Ccc1 family n=1 Tax=Piptocephalis cylindrospora TaxID=1907219 RepID=A0A4P9Y5U3_9FUNG|nr:Ccc1 family [Piptocephalis cylindrospora]|eukprot:RKP14305.1 Ccc1 family [Piptocephalis cylindrospora]
MGVPGCSDHSTSIQIPNAPSHTEHHFSSPEVLRDAIIGLSDGLTVPFALAAGLSSLDSTRIVVAAGFAELVAGAISMGLGGYLAARTEADHYDAELAREYREVQEKPEEEAEEIIEILEPYGLDRATLGPVIDRLKQDPDKWVEFMMKFELNLERPDPHRSILSAVTIGGSYLLGGLIPLLPYCFISRTLHALIASSVITLLALLIFGYSKSRLISPKGAWAGAIQTMLVGAVAASAAYGLVTLFPEVK